MTNSRIIAVLTLGVAAIATFVFTWPDPPAADWPDRSIAVDCAKPSPGVPDGGIPGNELCNLVIEVPAWEPATACPASAVAFSGAATSNYGVNNETLERVAYVDIDKDGDAETAVLISCGGKGWRRQVAVLDRSPSGHVRTLEQIVVTKYPVAEIFDLVGTASGELRVQVGDYPSAPESANTTSTRQWLTFRSNGNRLIRTDGLTLTGNPKVSDLSVSATDISFAKPADGTRIGGMTATVRNSGSSTVPFSLRLTLPVYAEIVNLPPACTAAAPAPDGIHVVCEFTGVETNGASQVALGLRAPENPNQAAGQTPPTLVAIVTVKDGYADLGITPDSANYSIRLE
jgi:hypothetical protein